MFVPSFFLKVNIGLITDKQPMAAVFEGRCAGVHFITVADVDAVERTAYESCNGVCRAVGDTPVKHSFLVRLYHPGCKVGPTGRSVIPHESGDRYSKKRITQFYIVSTCQIIRTVDLQLIGFSQFYQGRI